MKSRIMTFSVSEYIKKRILLVFFILGLVAGTFIINTMNKGYYDKVNVTQDYYINMISDVVVDKEDIFRNGIVKYYKEFALILVCNCLFFGKVYNGLYLFFKGAGVGIILSSYVMKYGVKGLLVYIISIFPHYPVYIVAIILTICAGISMRNIVVDKAFRNAMYGVKEISINDIFRLGRRLLLYFVIILLFALVISMLETYVNIPLFQGYIENA